MGNNKVRRVINTHKRVTGLSSYELALKNGKFEGTEEDFVNKEMLVYNQIQGYKEELEDSLKEMSKLEISNMMRTNDLGALNSSSLDSIYELFKNDETIHKTNDRLSYTCTTTDNIISMYIGIESEAEGIQLKLDIISGLSIRSKQNGVWGKWRKTTFIEEDESC